MIWERFMLTNLKSEGNKKILESRVVCYNISRSRINGKKKRTLEFVTSLENMLFFLTKNKLDHEKLNSLK